MHFLYNWPTSMMGLFIVSLTLAAALGGYLIVQRFTKIRLDSDQLSAMIAILSIVTTINSLLLAFSAVQVWDAYSEAENNVDAEATTAGELARDLAAFRDPSADLASGALRVYLEDVIQTEWPKMHQSATANKNTGALFDALFDIATRIEPQSSRQEVLLAEVLSRINEMAELRDRRLLALRVSMHETLWYTILVSCALSFVLLYALPQSWLTLALISTWSVTLGLAFFFVLAVDRPFAGRVSISAEPLQHVIDAIDARAATARELASDKHYAR